MASLSIPEAVAENFHITSAAKLAYAEMFSRLKKGERPNCEIHDIGLAIALGGDDLIDALRSLEKNLYARLDESKGKLDDLIPEQMVRLSAVIVVEVQDRTSRDPESVDKRRYTGLNEAFWDEIQIGRTVYRGTVSKMMTEHQLSIVATRYTRKVTGGWDEEERVLVSFMPLGSLRKAWDWFDGYIENERDNFETDGEPVWPENPDDGGAF